jgi:UDP-N-acetylglucosamine transferase subunit ALG13
MKREAKIALICTAGGHFEQLTNLSDFYDRYDHFWVTNRNKQTTSALTNQRKYFVELAHYRKPWTYLWQVPFFVQVFLKEKPTHIVSTGSGRTALIPFFMARVTGVRFVYIDTFSRVYGCSKFGSFLLKVRHPVFRQWETHDDRNAVYVGPVFRGVDGFCKDTDSDYIFVTLGTREESFSRLIASVEELVKKGTIRERVVVQAGHTKHESSRLEIFDFCTPEEMEELIRNGKYVITQESAGVGTTCLKYQTRFLVMPRDYIYGELPSQSDMMEDLHLKLEEMGYTRVVHDAKELEEAIGEIDRLLTGFEFDNGLVTSRLTQIMEES